MELLDTRRPSGTLSAAAQRVLAYCREHNLAEMDNGQHNIVGDDFFVNIFTYTTQPPGERIWEAHRAYIDVHVVLEGSEIIAQSFIDDSECGAYHADRDYLEIAPQHGNTHFTLKPGWMAVLYPEDAHQTGVLAPDTHPVMVRKAVFKIRV